MPVIQVGFLLFIPQVFSNPFGFVCGARVQTQHQAEVLPLSHSASS
jgi:hypothetical protein